MSQVYPTTLFKDGHDLTDSVVVTDPGEQAHAATQGYFPHGEGPQAAASDHRRIMREAAQQVAAKPAPKPRKARA